MANKPQGIWLCRRNLKKKLWWENIVISIGCTGSSFTFNNVCSCMLSGPICYIHWLSEWVHHFYLLLFQVFSCLFQIPAVLCWWLSDSKSTACTSVCSPASVNIMACTFQPFLCNQMYPISILAFCQWFQMCLVL